MPRGLSLGMPQCPAFSHWECHNARHSGIGNAKEM
jgi:hypothetical protein